MSRAVVQRRLTAGAIAVILLTSLAIAGALRASAATSSLMTITSISPKKIAALTANETVTVTGTGFDNSVIDHVDLGPCTNATWIVASATSLVVKTPNNTCGAATASSTVPESITITDIDGNTVVFTGTASTGLFLIPPPSLAGSDPPFLDNSSSVTPKAKKLLTSGGQTVRVVAASDYKFVAPVALTIGGVSAGTPTITGSSNGNYLTFTAPAHAAGGVSLVITANGVAKTFTTATTGLAYWAPPTIAAVAPATVKAVAASGTGAPVVVTGTGFSTTAASNTVTVCGQSATVTTSTATSLTFTTPDPAFTSGFEGVCDIRITVAGDTSPINVNSKLIYTTQ